MGFDENMGVEGRDPKRDETGSGPAGNRPRDVFHALIVVCAWVLFFYGWYRVLPITRHSDAGWAILVILVVSLCTVGLTLGWIRYNLGIYHRKGPRRTIPDIPERFDKDALGNDLVHEGWQALRASRLITVAVDGEKRKTYSDRED